MKKKFEDELKKAYGEAFIHERNRIHQETVRDKNRAAKEPEIKGPDPWKPAAEPYRPVTDMFRFFW